MKRQLRAFIAVVCVLALNHLSAQSFQLEGTNYIGSMPEGTTADWTKGWANFDAKNAVYGDPTDLTTLDGMAATLPSPGVKRITTTLTLDATKVYLLKGLIVVDNGGKLVIPAGTVIRCAADVSVTPKNLSSIVVERGGKIEITGTATNPVVMTSSKAIGQRERGDWGGLLIAGKSTHNNWTATGDTIQMEGFNNAKSFAPGVAIFGGIDPADNSGVIKYLRLEFGGLAFEANKEINGLTLGAVGSGTELHHVQVSFSGDDSFEWFGGTVNSKYLIAWKGTDDDFDTDNGYSGISQFGLGVRDAEYFDLSWNAPKDGSTSEGFESDNESSGTAARSLVTNAVFSNFTMLGPVAVGKTYADLSATTKGAFRRGARIRRNSSLRIVNSIFMGYRNSLMIDGDSCIRNTNFPAAYALTTPNTAVNAKTKQIMFSNNIICNTAASAGVAADTTANGLVEITKAALYTDRQPRLNAINDWARSTASANKIDPVAFTAGTLLVSPLASSTAPDFRPVAGSPALTGGGFRFVGTPIGDLISDAKEIAAARVAPIFPNPISNGTINFGRQVAAYGIFDIKGQLIAHGFDTDRASIDGFAKGMYFIKLDGKVQKLIVQ